jgi:hypothetical protein
MADKYLTYCQKCDCVSHPELGANGLDPCRICGTGLRLVSTPEQLLELAPSSSLEECQATFERMLKEKFKTSDEKLWINSPVKTGLPRTFKSGEIYRNPSESFNGLALDVYAACRFGGGHTHKGLDWNWCELEES